MVNKIEALCYHDNFTFDGKATRIYIYSCPYAQCTYNSGSIILVKKHLERFLLGENMGDDYTGYLEPIPVLLNENRGEMFLCEESSCFHAH